MNAMLILIPLAGLGLTGTLVLRGMPGAACKQQAACAAAKAAPVTTPAPAPVAEPSVASRSLVRFLGDEPVSAAAQTTQAGPAAGLVSVGQVGQGTVAAGAVQTHACEPAAGAVACEAAVAQTAPAQAVEARRQAELAYTSALKAQTLAQESHGVATLRAKEAQLAAAHADQRSRVYTELTTAQAGQARAGDGDAYTRSLERRIEALERRLAERDHAAATPATPATPPGVYYARPGSGARIVRTPGAGGGAEYWDGEAPEPLETPEVIELEDLEELPADVGGVVVVSPDGRTRRVHPPAAVAAPRAPLLVAPRADAPSAFGGPRAMNAPGGGGGELSELTRLIEEMRAQVGELQRDLESLRADLSRVRAGRNSGAR